MRKTIDWELWESAHGVPKCSAEPIHGEDAGFSRRSVGLQLAHALHHLKTLVHGANTNAGYAARKLDQYAAQKVSHLRGGYSTPTDHQRSVLLCSV